VRAFGLLLIALLLTTSTAIPALAQPVARHVNPNEVAESYDGVPALKLLSNAINEALSLRKNLSVRHLNTLEGIPVPESIREQHLEVVRSLKDLVLLLFNVSALTNEAYEYASLGMCSKASETAEEVRRSLIEVFKLKLRLIDEGLLNSYARSLASYVRNPSLKFMMSREVGKLISELGGAVEVERSRVIELLTLVSRCATGRGARIELETSPKMLFGHGNISVLGRVTDLEGRGIPNAPVEVGIYVLDYRDFKEVLTNSSGFFKAVFKAPPASKVFRAVAAGGGAANVKAYAYFTGNLGGGTVIAYREVPIKISYSRPTISATCPERARPLKDLNITVYTNIDVDLTVYIDSYPVLNVTLRRGGNVLVIPGARLTPGFHTLGFQTIPKGGIGGARYTCALAVTEPTPSINIVMNYIAVYPIGEIGIVGRVLSEGPEALIRVYVDGVKRAETRSSGPFTLAVPPPISLLAEFHRVVVEASYEGGLTSYRVCRDVVVVNPVGLAVLVIASFIALTHHPRVDVSIAMSRIASAISWVFARRARAGGVLRGAVREVFYEFLRIPFRASKLVKLYKEAVSVVARFAGSPKESETLKEYLGRAVKKLPPLLSRAFRVVTMVTEKDLYSRWQASMDEVELARSAVKVIKREG